MWKSQNNNQRADKEPLENHSNTKAQDKVIEDTDVPPAQKATIKSATLSRPIGFY